jgi:hypothetical protein
VWLVGRVLPLQAARLLVATGQQGNRATGQSAPGTLTLTRCICWSVTLISVVLSRWVSSQQQPDVHCTRALPMCCSSRQTGRQCARVVEQALLAKPARLAAPTTAEQQLGKQAFPPHSRAGSLARLCCSSCTPLWQCYCHWRQRRCSALAPAQLPAGENKGGIICRSCSLVAPELAAWGSNWGRHHCPKQTALPGSAPGVSPVQPHFWPEKVGASGRSGTYSKPLVRVTNGLKFSCTTQVGRPPRQQHNC